MLDESPPPDGAAVTGAAAAGAATGRPANVTAAGAMTGRRLGGSERTGAAGISARPPPIARRWLAP